MTCFNHSIIFILVFSYACLFPFKLKSQSMSPFVIASMGDEYHTGTLSFSWTLGETSIKSMEETSYFVTQGFHQPQYFFDVAVDDLVEGLNVIIYPNPATDQVYFIFSNRNLELKCTLTDLSGKIILNQQMSASVPFLDISGLPAGIFLVILKGEGTGILQTLKLVKN